MTAAQGWGKWAQRAPMRRVLALLFFVLAAVPALAEDRVQLFVTNEQGFGRLVLNFPDRFDLPEYRIRYDNGVLAVEFDEPISGVVPDVAVTRARLRDHRAHRSRPDGHPLRAPDDVQRQSPRSRRKALHRPDAGDLAGPAARPAARRWSRPFRSAQRMRQSSPSSGGRPRTRCGSSRWRPSASAATRPSSACSSPGAPTTEGAFAVEGTTANLDFDWPVPIDLYGIKADLPPELLAVENSVSPDGSRVAFTIAEGVVPRFYAISPTEFVVDVDIVPVVPATPSLELYETPEPDPHAAAAETGDDDAGGARDTADDGRAVRHRRRQHGAAGIPVRARRGRRGVPARRQRLDAVRHVDRQHRRAAEPVDADAGRRRLLGARRGRHAGGPSRPHHRAPGDARDRRALVGAVARRHHPLAHRADPAQPPPRRRGAVRDDRRSRPSRHHPPVPRSDGRATC